jgi:hypothetical protein
MRRDRQFIKDQRSMPVSCCALSHGTNSLVPLGSHIIVGDGAKSLETLQNACPIFEGGVEMLIGVSIVLKGHRDAVFNTGSIGWI